MDKNVPLRIRLHNGLWQMVSKRTRVPRMRRFASYFNLTEDTRILDIGGTPLNWELIDAPCHITLLNLEHREDGKPRTGKFERVTGSALEIPFDDNTFDIAFSNSVIEHVATLENQRRFASEMRRVARGVWMQTPAREFPMEPHLLAPFIHYLPQSVQKRLVRWFTIYGWTVRPTPEMVDNILTEIRLMSHSEVEELFPDCEMLTERFALLTKAHIALRRVEPLKSEGDHSARQAEGRHGQAGDASAEVDADTPTAPSPAV